MQLFRERLSNETVRDNGKRVMGNGGFWSLIEILGVSATETAQTNVQTLSTHTTNRHSRVRFYAFVEQLYTSDSIPICCTVWD